MHHELWHYFVPEIYSSQDSSMPITSLIYQRKAPLIQYSLKISRENFN
jgi:hypothetical protein